MSDAVDEDWVPDSSTDSEADRVGVRAKAGLTFDLLEDLRQVHYETFSPENTCLT